MTHSIYHLFHGKLNVASFSLLIALLLFLAGTTMIFMGIKDHGAIDFSSPFLTGQAKTGFVGVTLILSSVLICLGALHYRAKIRVGEKNTSEQVIKIKNGDIEIEWRGHLYYWSESHHIKSLLEEIMKQLASQNANKLANNDAQKISTS